ncbi:MAG: hypothetical protein ACFCVE_04085 [Phycisphaerae bacterium]
MNDLNLEAGIRPPTEDASGFREGYLLYGRNVSDDLFMYLTRRLAADEGVLPGAEYLLTFDVEFHSRDSAGSFGGGGAPAADVFVKVGGSSYPIETSLDANSGLFGNYRINIDKSNQGASGSDASIAGNVANGLPATRPDGRANDRFNLARRTHTHPNPVRADADGNLYIVVGTESGFQATTTLYYRSISVTLTPVTS